MNRVRNYQKELEQMIERIGAAKECPPTLFLHSCCAPCSSYVLEYLRQYFRITVFYFNPNITEDAEYCKRVEEQKRLIAAYNEELTKMVSANPDGVAEQDAIAKQYAGAMQHVGAVEDAVAVQEAVAEQYAGLVQDTGTVHGADRQQAESAAYRIDVIEGDYEPQRFYEMAKGLEQCPEGGERCFACYELRLRETAKLAREGGYDYFTTTLSISPLKNAAKLNEIGEKLAQEYGAVWLPSDFKKKDGYKRSIELSKEYGLYRQDYCGCVYSKRQISAGT